MAKVLILGAGLVARPIVRHLLESGIELTLASNTPDHALEILEGHPLGKSVYWTDDNEVLLNEMVMNNDLVVSLLPYVFHVKVAKCCIAHQKNMVTTSYVSPEMKALDHEAKQAGIIILNELGLDPGLDHMGAKRIIDYVHEKGGKIEEFYSFCGALAAPEALNNPFNYRFSWSPRGVVLAAKNGAKYLENGQITTIPEIDLFKDVRLIDFPGIGEVEVYPNRDSLSYVDLYGIAEVKSLMRGTIRFRGWCEIWDIIKRANLLSAEEMDVSDKTYAVFMSEMMNSGLKTDIRHRFANAMNIAVDSKIVEALDWLGLFSEKLIRKQKTTPFDVLADLMIPRMLLGKEERDMVLMIHLFQVSYRDGSREVIRSKMLDYGIKGGDTSIARTVSLPAAIGVKMILENKIKAKGVHIPVIKEIYDPILTELKDLHIEMEEEFGLRDLKIEKAMV